MWCPSGALPWAQASPRRAGKVRSLAPRPSPQKHTTPPQPLLQVLLQVVQKLRRNVVLHGGGAGSRTRVRKCSTRDSTCVARALSSLHRSARGQAHRATSRSCCLVARRSALRDDQPTHDVRSGPQAQPGRRPHCLSSESKRVIVRVSVFATFFTRPGGILGTHPLASHPSSKPFRPLSLQDYRSREGPRQGALPW